MLPKTIVSVRDAEISLGGGDEAFTLSIGQFDLLSGDIAVVLGGNGSGKTSFIRTLYGQISLVAGSIFREASSVWSLIDVDMNRSLVPSLSVKEHLVLALSLRERRSSRHSPYKVSDVELLGHVEATLGPEVVREVRDLLRLRIVDLSSGQKQMVVICMSGLNGSDVVLADETTANMDNKNTALFGRMCASLSGFGRTTVIVTHDWGIVGDLGNCRILFAVKKEDENRSKIIDRGLWLEMMPRYSACGSECPEDILAEDYRAASVSIDWNRTACVSSPYCS